MKMNKQSTLNRGNPERAFSNIVVVLLQPAASLMGANSLTGEIDNVNVTVAVTIFPAFKNQVVKCFHIFESNNELLYQEHC